jgi:hypothetical protein
MSFTKRFTAYKSARIDAKAQLLRDTLQFVLQRDEKRFAKLLLANLFGEGCNLPLALAKPRFYELMIEGLPPQLPPRAKESVLEGLPAALSQLAHVQFYDTVLCFQSRVKDSEKRMALQVIDSLAQIKDEWQLDQRFFTEELEQFDDRLQEAVEQFGRGASTGGLADIPIERVRRRLYVALTSSLFKYITDPQAFHSEFGSIPEVMTAIQKDHRVFCRVMAFFRTRIPYFIHLASQTFWRTLQTLCTESRPDDRQPLP